MSRAVILTRDGDRLALHFVPGCSLEGSIYGIFANYSADRWSMVAERREDGTVCLTLFVEGKERARAIITPPDAPPINKFVLTLDEIAALTEPCPE